MDVLLIYINSTHCKSKNLHKKEERKHQQTYTNKLKWKKIEFAKEI